MEKKDFLLQADIFAAYLTNTPATERIIARYQAALEYNKGNPSARDERLLRFIAKHHWSLRFMDAGTALVSPHSEVRRRLYVMLAILESDPQYTDFFLTQKRGRLYIFVVMFAGVKAVCRALIGIVLLKVVK